MRRLLREPLLHFAILGLVLFAALSFAPDRDRRREDRIVVTAGKVEHLAALFARTWQRPPTAAELRGIVDDHLREEIAYREGRAAGLDLDDTIIRRRLRQKLEFIAEDLAAQAEPDDAELAAYLAAHPDDFRVEPRLTFRQVFLDPMRRGAAVDDDARVLLDALAGDPAADASAAGDRTMLDHAVADASLREVAGLFGEPFAAAISTVEPGAWRGPIESAYGVHLVRVDRRVEGRLPALDEVRSEVRREWENARREEAIDRFYQALLERYSTVVEWPAGDGEEPAP